MYQVVQENIYPTLRTTMKEAQYDYSNDFTEFESVQDGIGNYGQSIYSFEEDVGVYMTQTIVDYVYLQGILYASHKLRIPRQLGERVAKSQIYCTKLHSCCLELKEGFTTVTNNEYTLHMIYEYCQGESLFSANIPIAHVIIQLLSCIKAIHLKKLHFGGCLHPHKIFYTKGLVKIGAIGIGAVLFDDESLDALQSNDIIQFGYMILEIITHSIPFLEVTPLLLEQIKESWIREIIYKCVTKSFNNIDDLLLIASPHMYNSINIHANCIDIANHQVVVASENKRISDMLFKLGFINERSNYLNDENWSDIGGNYLLKLFRDFIFHQVDDQGKPVLDLYHCIYHLNKVLHVNVAG